MTEYIQVVTTVDSAEEACPQDTQRNSAGSLVWTMRAVAVRGLRVPVWRWNLQRGAWTVGLGSPARARSRDQASIRAIRTPGIRTAWRGIPGRVVSVEPDHRDIGMACLACPRARAAGTVTPGGSGLVGARRYYPQR